MSKTASEQTEHLDSVRHRPPVFLSALSSILAIPPFYKGDIERLIIEDSRRRLPSTVIYLWGEEMRGTIACGVQIERTPRPTARMDVSGHDTQSGAVFSSKRNRPQILVGVFVIVH